MIFTWEPVAYTRLPNVKCTVVALVRERGRVVALFCSESRARNYAARLNKLMEPANG